MKHRIDELKAKILEFHPEITQKSIDVNITFDDQSQKYVVKLNKAGQEFGISLEKQDADDCLAGVKCLNLAVQMAQALAELESLLTPRRPG